MILILDFKIGNVGAVYNALNFLKFKSKISNNAIDIKNAYKIIIPGNGNFGEGIKKIKNLKIIDDLNEKVLVKKTPILGICLGYQIMFKKSEENENYSGLNWISGGVKKFKKKKFFPVPHVGWNNINFKNFSLAKNIPNNSKFYFNHSYYTKVLEKNQNYGETNYINKFKSLFEKENIFGCQPHLEKSQKFGLQMLKNFCDL